MQPTSHIQPMATLDNAQYNSNPAGSRLPQLNSHQFECWCCHVQVQDALLHARVFAVTNQLHLHPAGQQ
jgi:hypothetical protein